MLWVLAVVFGVFEFGERMSGTFDEISDVYEEFSWYLFPSTAQRMLTTLIILAQRPIEIQIIGSITCGRITFKNVSRLSYVIIQTKMKMKIIHLSFV